MKQDWEEVFVRAFIQPERRERYLALLADPRRRRKILERLYHNLDVVPALTAEVPGGEHTPAAVERLLRGKGAGEACYILSPQRELDQQELPLKEAVARLIQEDGVGVVLCIPERLAYYKGEDAAFILERIPVRIPGPRRHQQYTTPDKEKAA